MKEDITCKKCGGSGLLRTCFSNDQSAYSEEVCQNCGGKGIEPEKQIDPEGLERERRQPMSEATLIYEENDLRVVKVPEESEDKEKKIYHYYYEERTGGNLMGKNWETVARVTKMHDGNWGAPEVLKKKQATGKSFKALCKKLDKEV